MEILLFPARDFAVQNFFALAMRFYADIDCALQHHGLSVAARATAS
ncbi:hypothetical protein LJR098_005957 [Rhizobium sp. LjRoot98]|nr:MULTISPECIES: hypothetical protein [unclassified Rhizobium]